MSLSFDPRRAERKLAAQERFQAFIAGSLEGFCEIDRDCLHAARVLIGFLSHVEQSNVAQRTPGLWQSHDVPLFEWIG